MMWKVWEKRKGICNCGFQGCSLNDLSRMLEDDYWYNQRRKRKKEKKLSNRP